MFSLIYKPTLVNKVINLISPWLLVISLISFASGLYLGLFNSPADYLQGELVRIMYVHVPSAWISMFIYIIIAVSSIVFLVWQSPIANEIAKSSAPIGAVFTFVTLITGALWGKPTWGTWWVWDARLTSMLILFCFYLGYIALCNAYINNSRSKAPPILATIGVVNIPIVKFSVDLWSTLHQPASIIRIGGPKIHSLMLWPLSFFIIGSLSFYLYVVAIRLKTKLLKHKLERLQLAMI